MSQQIIEAINTVSVFQFTGDTAELRLYPTQSFLTSTGQMMGQGSPWNVESWYLPVTCDVQPTGILYVPSFEIPSTTDGQPRTSKYIAALFDEGGAYVGPFPLMNPNGFAIPPPELMPSPTWGQLQIYNRLPTLLYPPITFPTRDEMYAAIAEAISEEWVKSSATVVGATALSVDPTSPVFPIALGINDPSWLELLATILGGRGFYFLSNYASLATAVTDIGVARATLLIDSVAAVATNLTIPANITLFFTNAGGIQPANGVTVTVVGPITAPLMKVFYNATSGLGTISASGNESLDKVYPQWWGATGDGTTDDLLPIRAALAFGAGRNVHFPAGTYQITNYLTVAASTTVSGDGYGSTVKAIDGGWNISTTGGNYGIFNVRSASKVRFTNLRIYGNRTLVVDGSCDGGFPGNCHSPKLIYSETVDGLMIDHCWLENALWEGIWQGGTVVDNTGYLITNNYFKDIDGPSAITGNFENSVISNNYIVDCKYGIAVIGRFNTITGNTLVNIEVKGIAVGENLPQSDEGFYTVTGNTIYLQPTSAASYAGISVNGTSTQDNHVNTVSGNTVYLFNNPDVGVSGAAIEVENKATDVNISGNTVEIEGAGQGFRIFGSVDGTRVGLHGNSVRVTNELSNCIGFLTFIAVGTTLTLNSSNNNVYGITRASSGYAFTYSPGSGTLTATMAGDYKTEGSIQIGGATYNTSLTDNVPLFLSTEITGNGLLSQQTMMGMLSFTDYLSITIASGVITIEGISGGTGRPFRQTRIAVHTEGGGASDDLDTINGGQDGDILIIKSLQDAADTTLKNGTGNLQIGSDFTLATTRDRIVLEKSGSNWYQISRSTN